VIVDVAVTVAVIVLVAVLVVVIFAGAVFVEVTVTVVVEEEPTTKAVPREAKTISVNRFSATSALGRLMDEIGFPEAEGPDKH
jgi:hypothetical protein